jgi:hypothetical protein
VGTSAMKVEYRGFDIDIEKANCLAGYKLTYFSVFRKSDGYEMTSGVSDDDDTLQTWIGMMKGRVDGFILMPSEEMSATDADENYYDMLVYHHAENMKTERL